MALSSAPARPIFDFLEHVPVFLILTERHLAILGAVRFRLRLVVVFYRWLQWHLLLHCDQLTKLAPAADALRRLEVFYETLHSSVTTAERVDRLLRS